MDIEIRNSWQHKPYLTMTDIREMVEGFEEKMNTSQIMKEAEEECPEKTPKPGL